MINEIGLASIIVISVVVISLLGVISFYKMVTEYKRDIVKSFEDCQTASRIYVNEMFVHYTKEMHEYVDGQIEKNVLSRESQIKSPTTELKSKSGKNKRGNK